MTRAQAFTALLACGLTRRQAKALLRAAKRDGSAVSGRVRAGCHPYTRRYYVTGA
jgi:hypothetical protein